MHADMLACHEVFRGHMCCVHFFYVYTALRPLSMMIKYGHHDGLEWAFILSSYLRYLGT